MNKYQLVFAVLFAVSSTIFVWHAIRFAAWVDLSGGWLFALLAIVIASCRKD